MSLTLGSLLYPYGAFLALFAIGVLVDLYHMVRFGTFGWSNYIAVFVFLAGTAVILWGTSRLLAGVDFSQPLLTFSVSGIPGAGFGSS